MSLSKARKILKQTFGFDSFYPLQEEIIKTVLDRQNCLVLMPTGGGKSICYQIPALLLPEICIVVSPLISLMKDQVEALKANGIAAAFLNSSLTPKEDTAIQKALVENKLRLLYVAPERLVTQGFLDLLKKLRVSLFAIDEAHCISVWGHDFRPEYASLSLLSQDFPKVPIIALTATADRATRSDILKQLQIIKARVFIASFDRPNIKLTLLPAAGRIKTVIDFIRARPEQSGIVYCLSRKTTESLAERLRQAGIKALCYHAQIGSKRRSEAQEKFIHDQVQVVCATIAFGMGIDKSNVRFVIHYNLPANVESYYQEIGRAGRDGVESEAVLFYTTQDVINRRRMILGDELDGKQQRIKLEKLNKLQYFAETLTCRRQWLLKYFDERHPGSCANCDTCLVNQPEFDGTEASYKAMSALVRIRQPINLFTLVNVLRGSQANYIRESGFNKIKTYGVGKDIGAIGWRQYIRQLIDQGLIGYSQNGRGKLQLTKQGRQVLFDRKPVTLTKSPFEVGLTRKRDRIKKVAFQPGTDYDSDLFEELRKLRKQFADAQNLPAYIVFSDATLKQMAAEKPTSKKTMLAISGVGEKKYKSYGKAFIKVVRQFTD